MANLNAKAKKIKLVGTDIDGVWTDSKMYVTPDGELMKSMWMNMKNLNVLSI